MAELAAPVRVSPFIRGCRWGALVLGIMWGISRQSSLSKKEAKLREIEAKKKVILDAKRAEEKKRLNKVLSLVFIKLIGLPAAVVTCGFCTSKVEWSMKMLVLIF
ncbi:ATP synthase subunit e, mitochondrial-like [Centruroides sculpturatus]|uniref:ATP synthase subunit e, mitochondrial-like n=1 Tax=Centruroides sculpturatus TaxID=218467 RepID=UPI000C6E8F0B|nr:ATP synthase subunit e, mitochondrial-like [Centruroides sculpturatus]